MTPNSTHNLYGYAVQDGAYILDSGHGGWNSGGNGFMVYLKNNLTDNNFFLLISFCLQKKELEQLLLHTLLMVQ